MKIYEISYEQYIFGEKHHEGTILVYAKNIHDAYILAYKGLTNLKGFGSIRIIQITFITEIEE